jgi:hypothetical protein
MARQYRIGNGAGVKDVQGFCRWWLLPRHLRKYSSRFDRTGVPA